MTITIPSGRTLPLQAKSGGGFESSALSGAPVPDGLNATGVVAHGNTLTITDSDSRLGTKDQAAPRYWIFGDEVYVDGVAQNDFANTASESPAPNTSYLSASVAQPDITEARAYRHNRVSRHLHGTGRTMLGQFENLKNEAVAEGVRNALYVSWWMRLGFNPSFGTQWREVASITGTPDFGSDPNDADGEEFELNGSVSGRLIGLVSDSGTDYVVYKRYSSSEFGGETIIGVTSGASITFAATVTTPVANFGNYSAKSVRSDPLVEPSVVSIGINEDTPVEHFIYDSNRDSIYTVKDIGANLDVGDLAEDDTPEYDDRANPFPRWGHHHYWLDFTDTYMRDRVGRDFKKLKYQSTYEHLIAQVSPPVDQTNGLIPISRSSVNAPTVIDLGYDTSKDIKQAGNVDFSEILVDRTPRRVVIGNAATWAQVTRVEDQRTTAWAANQVDFALNLGAFGDAENFWIYVMDDLDEPIFTDGIPRSEIS